VVELEFFFDILSINAQILIFMKIRPVGAGLLHTDGRTERKADMTRLTARLLNSAKAPMYTPLRRLGVDGRIILEWILITWDRRA